MWELNLLAQQGLLMHDDRCFDRNLMLELKTWEVGNLGHSK